MWRAKTQAEQVRDFITGFLDGFEDPGVRAKEAVARALRFRQKSQVPTTSVYLEIKELHFDEALREGNTAGQSTHAPVVKRSGAGMLPIICWFRSKQRFAIISLMSASLGMWS